MKLVRSEGTKPTTGKLGKAKRAAAHTSGEAVGAEQGFTIAFHSFPAVLQRLELPVCCLQHGPSSVELNRDRRLPSKLSVSFSGLVFSVGLSF